MLIVAAVLAIPAVLYVTAPVGDLRGAITYRPIGSTRERVAGLGVEENLHLTDVPESLLVALLFSEDKKFFEHGGFDFEEMWTSLGAYLFEGKRLRGASTISQQLVKCLLLDDTRSLRRKGVEAVYAAKLERSFTKKEILVLYLNNIEWGDEVYGLRAAAERYFGKAPLDLVEAESAFLATIVPNPAGRAKRWSEGLLPSATVSRVRTLRAVLATLDGDAAASDLRVEPADREAVARLATSVRRLRAASRARMTLRP